MFTIITSYIKETIRSELAKFIVTTKTIGEHAVTEVLMVTGQWISNPYVSRLHSSNGNFGNGFGRLAQFLL